MSTRKRSTRSSKQNAAKNAEFNAKVEEKILGAMKAQGMNEEQAKETLARIKTALSGGSRVRAQVVIEFDVPHPALAQAAIAFLHTVVGESIVAAKWGEVSFQSGMGIELAVDSKKSKSEPETKSEAAPPPSPTSPLN